MLLVSFNEWGKQWTKIECWSRSVTTRAFWAGGSTPPNICERLTYPSALMYRKCRFVLGSSATIPLVVPENKANGQEAGKMIPPSHPDYKIAMRGSFERSPAFETETEAIEFEFRRYA